MDFNSSWVTSLVKAKAVLKLCCLGAGNTVGWRVDTTLFLGSCFHSSTRSLTGATPATDVRIVQTAAFCSSNRRSGNLGFLCCEDSAALYARLISSYPSRVSRAVRDSAPNL
jgi:hypothetical protein